MKIPFWAYLIRSPSSVTLNEPSITYLDAPVGFVASWSSYPIKPLAITADTTPKKSIAAKTLAINSFLETNV